MATSGQHKMPLLFLGRNYYTGITKEHNKWQGQEDPKVQINQEKKWGVNEDLKNAPNMSASRNVKKHSG